MSSADPSVSSACASSSQRPTPDPSAPGREVLRQRRQDAAQASPLAGAAGLVAVTGNPTAWLAIAVAAVVALLVRMSGAPV